MPRISVTSEVWPLRGAFKISRGAKTEAHVVKVALTDGEYTGCGECVPYA
ncbi:MAG TPA: dipeptide epimerase, partial [Thalassospira sp.]|nr:dipeptide epimerase [Thalassospira sp.]